LAEGELLWQGESVTSCNGQYILKLQSDGNLVLYHGSRARWATGVGWGGGAYIQMQPDGNLVEYTSDHRPIWASGSSSPGAQLLVQDDGNMVIYSAKFAPVWSARGWLAPGAELVQGGFMTSHDERFTLSMQTDGNLVLYFGTEALWGSGTTNGMTAVMQSDGNLGIYDRSNMGVWGSGTNNDPGAWLAVQTDGNMVLYSPPAARSTTALWATDTCCH
jgi:hypothetical protein